jgi:hypothetical protein
LAAGEDRSTGGRKIRRQLANDSNLRRYVEALGGSLEITARFPDGAVKITNFSDLGNDREPQGGAA